MNIASSQRPTVDNRGLFTRRVKVRYEKPKTEWSKTLGVIPEDERWVTAPESPRTPTEVFVPSTLENPTRIPGFRDRPVTERNAPVLDARGKPEMETVETTLEVPGPKGEFLADLAGNVVLGGVTAAMPGVFGMGLGMLGTVLGGRAGWDILQGSATLMFGGLAVGAGIALVGTAISQRGKLTATNTLRWEDTPITSASLKGFNRVSEEQSNRFPEHFEPVLETTQVGRYQKPVVSSQGYGL